MISFAPLRPLIPYRAPEAERERELSTLDRRRSEALAWLAARGIEPGFKENRKQKES